jgi:hypothetical protein
MHQKYIWWFLACKHIPTSADLQAKQWIDLDVCASCEVHLIENAGHFFCLSPTKRLVFPPTKDQLRRTVAWLFEGWEEQSPRTSWCRRSIHSMIMEHLKGMEMLNRILTGTTILAEQPRLERPGGESRPVKWNQSCRHIYESNARLVF